MTSQCNGVIDGGDLALSTAATPDCLADGADCSGVVDGGDAESGSNHPYNRIADGGNVTTGRVYRLDCSGDASNGIIDGEGEPLQAIITGVTTKNLGAATDRQIRMTLIKPGTEGVLSTDPYDYGREYPAVDGEAIVWWDQELLVGRLFIGQGRDWVEMFGGAFTSSRQGSD